MLTWKIGDIKVSCIVELQAPGIEFIVPEATVDGVRDIAWLRPYFVDEHGVPVCAVQAFIVESGGRRIVVDTCIGNDKNVPLKFWANRHGPFLEDLRAAGFPPESIDTVLCTHLHIDHVGWNTMLVDGKWVPTFPRAEYIFGRVEWEHWDKNRSRRNEAVIAESIEPILEAGLAKLVEMDHRLSDEVWLEPTPGHTPGHVSVRLSSRGENAIISGDVMHHPCQMARPDWACAADWDAEAGRTARKKFLARCADAPILYIGTHFPAPTAGQVVRDGAAYRLNVDGSPGRDRT